MCVQSERRGERGRGSREGDRGPPKRGCPPFPPSRVETREGRILVSGQSTFFQGSSVPKNVYNLSEITGEMTSELVPSRSKIPWTSKDPGLVLFIEWLSQRGIEYRSLRT